MRLKLGKTNRASRERSYGAERSVKSGARESNDNGLVTPSPKIAVRIQVHWWLVSQPCRVPTRKVVPTSMVASGA